MRYIKLFFISVIVFNCRYCNKLQYLFNNYQVSPIRVLKLFLISVIVFGIMLFFLSLLFPSTTYVSRAVNVKGNTVILFQELPQLHNLAFLQNQEKKFKLDIDSILNSSSSDYLDYVEDSPFIKSSSDTVLFKSPFSADIKQGLAIYQAGKDSTTIQVFYKIHVPFYKPWKKFALMLNETKYGPSLDSAISRISRQY